VIALLYLSVWLLIVAVGVGLVYYGKRTGK